MVGPHPATPCAVLQVPQTPQFIRAHLVLQLLGLRRRGMPRVLFTQGTLVEPRWSPQVYSFAYSFPFAYGDQQRYLAGLDRRALPFMERSLLCRSVQVSASVLPCKFFTSQFAPPLLGRRGRWTSSSFATRARRRLLQPAPPGWRSSRSALT